MNLTRKIFLLAVVGLLGSVGGTSQVCAQPDGSVPSYELSESEQGEPKRSEGKRLLKYALRGAAAGAGGFLLSSIPFFPLGMAVDSGRIDLESLERYDPLLVALFLPGAFGLGFFKLLFPSESLPQRFCAKAIVLRGTVGLAANSLLGAGFGVAAYGVVRSFEWTKKLFRNAATNDGHQPQLD